EDTRRFGGSLLRILESALMIAGLDVVMRQLLDCALRARAVLLESLGNVTMQTTAPNRIELLVKHFANLVVREAERVARAGGDQLRAHSFVERVQKCIFVLFSR